MSFRTCTIFLLISLEICECAMPSSWDFKGRGQKNSLMPSSGRCGLACEHEINSARDYTGSVHKELKKKSDAITKRISRAESILDSYSSDLADQISRLKKHLRGNVTQIENILRNNVDYLFSEDESMKERLRKLEMRGGEGGVWNGGDKDLYRRVHALERDLKGNVSETGKKMENELEKEWERMLSWVTTMERSIGERLDNIQAQLPRRTHPTRRPPGHHHPDNHQWNLVYQNLTRRIDKLEDEKVEKLIYDSNLWRNNFKVVNTTFEKWRRNKCMC